MLKEQNSGNSSRRNFVSQMSVIGSAVSPGGIREASAQTRDAPLAAPSGKLRKVALEEHFMIPEFIEYFRETKQNIKPELFDKVLPKLSDFGASRLDTMDKNGIDYVVLSLSGPGLQIEKDTGKADRLQRIV